MQFSAELTGPINLLSHFPNFSERVGQYKPHVQVFMGISQFSNARSLMLLIIKGIYRVFVPHLLQ